MINNMEQKYYKILEKILENNNIKKSSPIAIAVSGGCDSMALSLLTKSWAIKKNVNIVAINIDHNLRKESKKESKKVSEWMNKLKIKNEIITYKGKIPTANIEAEAREYRYNLIKKYCKDNNIKTLLVGHNLNEKTETFFLNLIRGSGVYGLSGMKEFSQRDGLNIIRPLMNFSKKELKSYLKTKKQKWIEDPSNKDEKYLRVKVRKLKKLFNKLGLEEDRIITTIESLQRARTAIEFYTDKAYKKILVKENGVYLLNTEEYKNHPEEIQLRFLSKLLVKFGEKNYSPRMKKLQNIHRELLNNFKNKKAMTLSGCKFTKKKDKKVLVESEVKN